MDIFSYLQGRVAGLKIIRDVTGSYVLTWRGGIVDVYLDEFKVDDDIEFVKRLMAEQAVKAVPGSFMGLQTEDGNPGAGYVRLALVHDAESTDEALSRVAKIYKS